jgi:hypothetical protein
MRSSARIQGNTLRSVSQYRDAILILPAAPVRMVAAYRVEKLAVTETIASAQARNFGCVEAQIPVS